MILVTESSARYYAPSSPTLIFFMLFNKGTVQASVQSLSIFKQKNFLTKESFCPTNSQLNLFPCLLSGALADGVLVTIWMGLAGKSECHV